MQKDPPPPQRRQDTQEASESGYKTEAEEEGVNKEGDRDEDNPREAPLEVICMGGSLPPPEENTDLPDFNP